MRRDMPIAASGSRRIAERQRKYLQPRRSAQRARPAGGAGTHRGRFRRGALACPRPRPCAIVVAPTIDDRLDALPPSSKYPELRGMRECVVAYNRGVATPRASVTTTSRSWRTTCRSSRAVSRAASRLRRPAARWSTSRAATAARWSRTTTTPPRTTRHHNEPGWIVANRAGLILGTVSSGIFDDEVSPERFPARCSS
jgi:hypothetical protein